MDDLRLNLVAEAVFRGHRKKSLVERDCELLLVSRYLSNVCHDSMLDDDGEGIYEGVVEFDVFRLDEKEKEWVELTGIRDRVLFLGEDYSFSASASDLCIEGNGVVYKCELYVPHRIKR